MQEVNICKAFKELMEEERLAGMEEGLKEGKQEGMRIGFRNGQKKERLLTIRRMLSDGYEESQIRRLTNCTRKELAAVAERFAKLS